MSLYFYLFSKHIYLIMGITYRQLLHIWVLITLPGFLTENDPLIKYTKAFSICLPKRVRIRFVNLHEYQFISQEMQSNSSYWKKQNMYITPTLSASIWTWHVELASSTRAGLATYHVCHTSNKQNYKVTGENIPGKNDWYDTFVVGRVYKLLILIC